MEIIKLNYKKRFFGFFRRPLVDIKVLLEKYEDIYDIKKIDLSYDYNIKEIKER